MEESHNFHFPCCEGTFDYTRCVTVVANIDYYSKIGVNWMYLSQSSKLLKAKIATENRERMYDADILVGAL